MRKRRKKKVRKKIGKKWVYREKRRSNIKRIKKNRKKERIIYAYIIIRRYKKKRFTI